ncbi:MAG: hypothetical protein V7637_2486 [Mycobacteriales bacterium]|jgi:uncharacterized membrane protein HdeD (DUF308 family)
MSAQRAYGAFDGSAQAPLDPRPDAPVGGRAGGAVAREARWPRILLGGTTAVLGGLAVLWPSPTVAVVAVLLGIQLLVYGAARIIQSVTVDDARVVARILFALLGVLSIVAGVLCLRRPLQTMTALVMLVGLFWLISGLIEIIRAVSDRSWNRGLDAVTGGLAALTGVVVLAWPQPTVLVMTVLVGLWLLVLGILTIVSAARRHGGPLDDRAPGAVAER